MDTGPKWYITRGQQRIGPIDASQLKHMAMTEQLAPTEYVWKEGMAQWVQAMQVQGLFDAPSVVVPLEDGPVSKAVSAVQSHAAPAASASSVSTPSSAMAPVTAAPASVDTPAVTNPATAPTSMAQARPMPEAIRAEPARVAAPALSQPSDLLLPMLGGLLLLATIFIPWGSVQEYNHGPRTTIFSWSVVKASFATGGDVIAGLWLIASWITGLAALVLTPSTRGISRASVNLIFGAVAAIFLIIVAFKLGAVEPAFKSGASKLESILGIVGGIALFLTLVVTHIIRRAGSSTGWRIVQIIVCLTLLISAIILLITAFSAKNSLWSLYGSWRVKAPWSTWLRATLLVDHIGTIVAGAMLLAAAFMGKSRGMLFTGGLILLYVVTLAALTLGLISEAGATDTWNELPAGINAALLVVGIAIVLGSGMVQMVSQLRSSGRR